MPHETSSSTLVQSPKVGEHAPRPIAESNNTENVTDFPDNREFPTETLENTEGTLTKIGRSALRIAKSVGIESAGLALITAKAGVEGARFIRNEVGVTVQRAKMNHDTRKHNRRARQTYEDAHALIATWDSTKAAHIDTLYNDVLAANAEEGEAAINQAFAANSELAAYRRVKTYEAFLESKARSERYTKERRRQGQEERFDTLIEKGTNLTKKVVKGIGNTVLKNFKNRK